MPSRVGVVVVWSLGCLPAYCEILSFVGRFFLVIFLHLQNRRKNIEGEEF
jgi:hypothetical protein